MEKSIKNPVVLFLVLLSVGPLWAVSEEPPAGSVFKQEELDQMVAPIALYPDSLISQIFMASTYPLGVVQADRWAKQNKDLQGDALTAALEKKDWDPSVKSLVNFPRVLTMMSENRDRTQKLGDAFLAQQKDVMDTVQKLRKKAYEHGVLKTTNEQVVKKVEPDIIVIESADPQMIYVPAYDPTEVYGEWPYSDYPPYDYYPEGYSSGSGWYSTGSGLGLGAAWGYARGKADWNAGDIGIDTQSGSGKWQHNPADRKGVPYRDRATAQKFNRASTPDAVKSREAYRGRGDQGVSQRGDSTGAARARASDMRSPGSYNRDGAFRDMDRGSSARNYSSRGQASRQSMSRPSGGGGRGGGGGRR